MNARVILNAMQPYSIYVHVPFCRHRCGYCDFNTYAGLENLKPAYVQALCREVEIVAGLAGERLPVHTIFFGGGTPSLLTIDEIESVLQCLDSAFELSPDIEITLEANPGTITYQSLKSMRVCGINRLSFGMQSSNPLELHLLERQHDFFDVIRGVGWARQAGFENINLDLIYGLPYQTLHDWLSSLTRAIYLTPDHLSLYALSLEHGAPMKNWVERGLLEEPDEDLAADMYETGSSVLAEAGFVQYEISNWARRYEGGEVKTCRHNLQYWRNLPYLGIGAGAHGFAGGLRIANTLHPREYIDRVNNHSPDKIIDFPQTPATVEALNIDLHMEMTETLMLGMRLVEEGVSKKAFRERFNVEVEQVYGEAINKLLDWGLVEWVGEPCEILRLTGRGRLLGNVVFREFL